MIPKLYFQRSWIYDQRLKVPENTERFEEDFIRSQIKGYEAIWQSEGDQILQELVEITKLQWHNPEIFCYVTIWNIAPFSDPLTINPRWEADRTRDLITHELIHRILSHDLNFQIIKARWDQLMEKYKEYSLTTRLHIPVHAIHEHIIRKFYTEKELERDKIKKFPDYYTAWEVVEKEGYKNIIKELCD